MTERERVRRIDDGAMGWRVGHQIYADNDPQLGLMTTWWINSVEDQEDLGVPAQGWKTAYGYWLPILQVLR